MSVDALISDDDRSPTVRLLEILVGEYDAHGHLASTGKLYKQTYACLLVASTERASCCTKAESAGSHHLPKMIRSWDAGTFEPATPSPKADAPVHAATMYSEV